MIHMFWDNSSLRSKEWKWSLRVGGIECQLYIQKRVREKSRECHNHKPQPFPDPKRKRKPTNPNKHKSNHRTKSTKISSLFPKRGNRNAKRTEKQKNEMTHGKTYNKSPRRINHKATKSKTNTGTTALERSVEFLILIVLGLTTRQPLWVILCRLPEKGRKEIEEIVEEIKERTGKKEEQEWKWRNRRNKKHSPSTLTCYKDSRPCPTVSQYQLDAPVPWGTGHLRTTRPSPTVSRVNHRGV